MSNRRTSIVNDRDISRRNRLFGTCAVLAVVAGVDGASFQARAQEAAPVAKAGSEVEEVVVMARQRAERLLDVPVAATAVTRETLERYATSDIANLTSQLPGVELQRSGAGTTGGAVSIRGVGQTATDFGTEQPVALVIDGIQITQGRALEIGLFDVDRIEVLKGPQALFFGRNSPAGVVAIYSTNPGPVLGGYFTSGYEFYTDKPFIEGAVNIPLSDTFFVRVATRYSDMNGGWVVNEARPILNPFPGPGGVEGGFTPGAQTRKLPAINTAAARISAMWEPTDQFSASVKVAYNRYRDVGLSGLSEVSVCAPGETLPSGVSGGVVVSDPFNDCDLDGHLAISVLPLNVTTNTLLAPRDGKPFQRSETAVAGLTLNYDAGPYTITSVTGYYQNMVRAFDTNDRSSFGQQLFGIREHGSNFSQEVRLHSDFEGPLNFFAGAFFSQTSRTTRTSFKNSPLGPDTRPGPFSGTFSNLLAQYVNDNKSYSVFGQLIYELTPTIEATLGARWSREEKSSDITQLFNRFDETRTPSTNQFAPAGSVFRPRLTGENFSPEATITWKPRDNLTLYAAYKTGYLPGAIQNGGTLVNYAQRCVLSVGCTNPDDLATYEDQTVEGGEVGFKASRLWGVLSGDIAVWRYEITNLQVSATVPDRNGVFILNAAGAINQGFEANARYRVSDSLTLRGAFTYSSLKYTEFLGAPCRSLQTPATGCVGGGQDQSGDKYGGPPFQAVAGLTYDRPVSSNWGVSLTADAMYRSREPRPRADPRTRGGEEVWLANAGARLYQTEGGVEFALVVTNLFDKVYGPASYTGKSAGAPGTLVSRALYPRREVTLQATYRW